jgi:hypothetical protein
VKKNAERHWDDSDDDDATNSVGSIDTIATEGFDDESLSKPETQVPKKSHNNLNTTTNTKPKSTPHARSQYTSFNTGMGGEPT